MFAITVKYLCNFAALNNSIMDNIEALLKEKRMTKTALAELLGIKKQNLNSLMKNPTMETIKKFATALNVPTWQLFVSPNDINNELEALVKHKGQFYEAHTIKELEALINQLKNK